MSIWTRCAGILMSVAIPCVCDAQVIFSSLGPGEGLAAWPPGDYVSDRFGSLPGTTNQTAYAFEAQTTARVSRVDIGLSRVGGPYPGDLVVRIMDDSGGEPGNVLESITVRGFHDGVSSYPRALVQLTARTRPQLTAGTRYWLVASAIATSSQGTNFLWIPTNGPYKGPRAARAGDNATWSVTSSDQLSSAGAFRVLSGDVSGPTDTDEDGLPDEWELNGIDIDADGVIDVPLREYGANPRRKDLFLHIRWMEGAFHTHKPSEEATQAIIAAFARAPVSNPDGTTGISLHIHRLSPIYESADLEELGDFYVGLGGRCDYNWNEFDTLLPPVQRLGHQRAFRFALFGHSLGSLAACGRAGSPSGIARNRSDEFFEGASHMIVSLGDEDRLSWGSFRIERDRRQAGTLMHELGHTLGLGHGGTDHVLYKPNQLSVMNYHFQKRGLRTRGGGASVYGFHGLFDYSRYSGRTVRTIDEADLDERIPLSGDERLREYGIRFSCPDGRLTFHDDLTTPVDWDCSDGPSSSSVSTDLNVAPDNPEGVGSEFAVANEWAMLKFRAGTVGWGASDENPMETSMPSPELTLEADALLGPYAVLDVQIDVLPGSVSNPLRSSRRGAVPVAVLSNSLVQVAADLDIESLRVGPTGHEAPFERCRPEDVNTDGLLDLLCHFRVDDVSVWADDGRLVVQGLARSGSFSVAGADYVRFVP